MKFKLIFFLIVICSFVNGEVLVSEIMYNPQGSDSGNEWIEIYNSGNESINLTGWVLYENEIDHELTFPTEEYKILRGKEYMLIVQSSFYKIHSNFSKKFVISSFSLKNKGEVISIKNSSLGIIEEFQYFDLAEEGYSIVKKDLDVEGDVFNWEQSKIKGGSAGKKSNLLITQPNISDNVAIILGIIILGVILIGIIIYIMHKPNQS
jgi:hypothetical protein